jgi:hypothetical protein
MKYPFGVRRLAFGVPRLTRCSDIRGSSLVRGRVELGFQRGVFLQRDPAERRTPNAKHRTPNGYDA